MAFEAREADLQATNDEGEALTLVRQRKALRKALTDASEAFRGTELVSEERTMAQTWTNGTVDERRGLLAGHFWRILVLPGTKTVGRFVPIEDRLVWTYDDEDPAFD